MSMPLRNRDWEKMVRDALADLNSLGIREAPPMGFFDGTPHVAIEVDGVEGVGIIHQQEEEAPLNLCVFEPNDHESGGWAEVFERTFADCDEMIKRIKEWKDFRLETSTGVEQAVRMHGKWLRAVALDKKKAAEHLRQVESIRNAGDLKAIWKASGFETDFEHLLPRDIPELARERLEADLHSVSPDLLAWHLPRDDRGKLILKRRIPLFRYDYNARSQSHFCLLVIMPERRDSRPALDAEWLRTDNQTARLDTARELFDGRVASQFARVFTGLFAPQLQEVWNPAENSSSLLSRIIQCQLRGEVVTACELAGVELDDTVRDCLRLRRVTHMCTCCAPLDRQLREWSRLLLRTLVALNLTRFNELAVRDEQLTSRKPRNEPVPILPLPLQRHSRKAHFALEISESNAPRLTIAFTGSGRRLPLALWRRPVDLDLLLEGHLTIDHFPAAAAAQMLD